MRKFNNFLFKDKYHVYPFFFKLRVLRFKRPKWERVQSRILYTLTKFHYIRVLMRFGRFSRLLQRITCVLKRINALLKLSKFYSFLIKKYKKKYIYRKKAFFVKYSYLKFSKALKFFSRHTRKLNRLISKFKLRLKPNRYRHLQRITLFTSYFLNFRRFKKIQRLRIRKKFLFKNRLLMKYTVLKYFYGYLSIKIFKKYFLSAKKIKKHKTLLSNLFLKPECRIDILLWHLKFFKTPYLARFACNKNLIFLNKNSLTVNNNFIFKKVLKKNDYIYYSSKFFFKFNLRHYAKTFHTFSFFEIDYYSNYIVMLKNLLDLNYRDITTALKEPICVYKFKDYLLK